MNIEIIIGIIVGVLSFVGIISLYGVITKNSQSMEEETFNNISEWSYKRYAKFYGKTELNDMSFDEKMNKIKSLIIDENCDDIHFIAEEVGCAYEDCILKINYLKNKRVIGDYYIDHVNGLIRKCSEEDKALIEKYKPYIYGSHSQIKDMLARLPGVTGKNYNEEKKKVIQELKYLLSKDLINGVILNEIDETITYYSIEKHKNENNIVTIECPSCGALNDVNIGDKKRCEYCNHIVDAKNYKEIIKESRNQK